jgi:anti-anti-sigma factor
MQVPDQPCFSLRVLDRSEPARLHLEGRFDLVAVPALDEAMREVRNREVIIDLGGLTFMDGAAWLAVMDLEHRVRDRGGVLRVVNVRGRIRKIFERTETEHLLDDPVSR